MAVACSQAGWAQGCDVADAVDTRVGKMEKWASRYVRERTDGARGLERNGKRAV